MEESKTCPRCGETKPLSGFYKRGGANPYIQSYCKVCANDEKKKWFSNRPFYAILHAAKKRAKDRGLPFDITEEYLESIWTGVCPVFQIRLDLPARGEGRKHKRSIKPSLDRLVPDKGYVTGNVIWISLRANQMKSDGTSEELFRVAEWLQQTEEEIKRHETD